MSEGENPDRVVKNEVDDTVRESLNWRSADRDLLGNVRHGRGRYPATGRYGRCRIHCAEEVRTKTCVLLVVPADGVFELS